MCSPHASLKTSLSHSFISSSALRRIRAK
ncbi:hypothetical protein E2C01_083971 [Portunus trituberculatus]|uniref:Uncharacterized protein n=1 Tax=Portunus trituberculatus TaxID=210409 RepID=A0A5B7J3M4_PORTR|nr:hypothetical protein [Portunus trituberculatus]